MRLLRAGVVVAVVASIVLLPLRAHALFSDSAGVGSNSFSTATLLPPTGVGASASCNGTAPEVALSWTSSTTPFAEGYAIYRSDVSGGTRSNIGSVDGSATVAFIDATGGLNTTYYYVVVTTGRGWTSVESGEASATTPAACP